MVRKIILLYIALNATIFGIELNASETQIFKKSKYPLVSKYLAQETINNLNAYIKFPLAFGYDHTMTESLEQFSFQKLPREDIAKCLVNSKCEVEIIGIPEEILLSYADELGYQKSLLRKINFKHNPRIKEYNYRRPTFFDYKDKTRGKSKLIVSIISGKDFIKHYSSIIRYAIMRLSNRYDLSKIKVRTFPEMETGLAQWTGLDHNFIYPNEIVIIGHVNEIDDFISKNANKGDWIKINEHHNYYYGSRRYRYKNQVNINFLGSRHSFWGDMSGILAYQIAKLGTKSLIYAAKLGTIESPDAIYNTIYSPDKFLILDYNRSVAQLYDVKNEFKEGNHGVHHGTHVSIPTIHEQDFIQRHIAVGLGAQSIDNEISHIANNISNVNKETGSDTSFSPIHFATDYLRSRDEALIKISHDLSNNRSKTAFSKKVKILERISQKILDLLDSKCKEI